MTISTSMLRSTPLPDLPPAPISRPSDSAVLVLRALGLGDALTAVPALRGIRRAWPDRWILLAADAAIGGWLRHLGLVDEVLDTNGLTHLDWPPPAMIGTAGHLAVNLHGRGPQSHRMLAATAPDRLVAFRQPLVGHLTGPAWQAQEHDVHRWRRLIATAGGPCTADDLRLPSTKRRSTEILLHPGAAAPARRWPADRWARVAAALAAAGHPVTITGTSAEGPLCSDILSMAGGLGSTAGGIENSAGHLPLPELADRVSGARLLVCGDTGVGHLATAYGTRSVLLFGPTSPRRWGPVIDAELHRVLWHGRQDAPGDPHGAVLDPALASIEVSEVLTAVHELLAAGHP